MSGGLTPCRQLRPSHPSTEVAQPSMEMAQLYNGAVWHGSDAALCGYKYTLFLRFEFEWGLYAQFASDAIFRARTYSRITVR